MSECAVIHWLADPYAFAPARLGATRFDGHYLSLKSYTSERRHVTVRNTFLEEGVKFAETEGVRPFSHSSFITRDS